MTILDTAADYHQTKQIENRAKAEAKPLGEAIKSHLNAGGSDYTVSRVDPNSGEISQALELPEFNVRYFMRSRAGAWKSVALTCENCGATVHGEVRTQSPSVALDSEPIADLRAEDERQRREQYARAGEAE